MRYVRYIETLAWVLLVGITGLWAILWLTRTGQILATLEDWDSYRGYTFSFSAAAAAGATILGCQAQRPLGVCRPFYVRMLLVVLAILFAFCLLFLVALLCLGMLLDEHWFTWCASISFGIFALALSMLHPALGNSNFSAAVFAVGLLSPLLVMLRTAPLIIAALLYFPSVLGLYAASLALRASVTHQRPPKSA